jgi:hypothetical protein
MTPPLFKSGQKVRFAPSAYGPPAVGTYTIVRMLPVESAIYQYRVMHTDSRQERVARESELQAA